MIEPYEFIDANLSGEKEAKTTANTELFNKLSAEETNRFRTKLNETISAVNATAIPLFPDFKLKYKAEGNTAPSTFEVGDIVGGFYDESTVWDLAIYNGGDVNDKLNYTKIYDNGTLHVNVKDFGAAGDAIYDADLSKYVGTDDTTAIQNAINTGLNVYFPEGKYLISDEMNPNSNTKLFGKTRLSSVIIMDGVVNGTPATYYNVFNIEDKQEINIDSLGFADGTVISYETFLSFSEACIAIKIFGSDTKRVSVTNCDFAFVQGHGVYDGSEESYNKYINNTGEGVGQNILNINSKFPTIHYNLGKTSGYGLLEASCGNGSIQFNEAFNNVKNGLTIGGFAGVDSDGYGSNNIISHNKCYGNGEVGIHLSAHCVDSIISENIIYQNKNFGISTAEPNDISSNLLITKNKIFDNGLNGETTRVGIYVASKDCCVVDNEIYNTGHPDYSTTHGISIDYLKHKQIIGNNFFRNITNWEIEINTNNDVILDSNPDDRINLIGAVNIRNKVSKTGIGYDGQPVTNVQKWIWVDNASSPKTAILPDAETYPEGEILTLVDEKGAAGTNNATFTVVSGNKINGVTDGTIKLIQNYQCLQLTNVKSTKNWIIVSNEINKLGHEDFNDTVHTLASPQSILEGVTDTLTNNKGTILSSKLPPSHATFFDSGTSKILPQYQDDHMITSIMFKAKNNNIEGAFTIFIDIPTLGERFGQSFRFQRGADVEQPFNVTISHFISSQFKANGGIIKVISDKGDTLIYDKQFRFCKVYSSI